MGSTDLFIDQGTDFSNNLTLEADDGSAVNIAGFVFSCQMRTSYYTANATANIAVTVTDAANGIATMSMSAANTANIYAARYVYDVKVVDSFGNTSRLVHGIITVTPQATH
jgi:hypothetical protein